MAQGEIKIGKIAVASYNNTGYTYDLLIPTPEGHAVEIQVIDKIKPGESRSDGQITADEISYYDRSALTSNDQAFLFKKYGVTINATLAVFRLNYGPEADFILHRLQQEGMTTGHSGQYTCKTEKPGRQRIINSDASLLSVDYNGDRRADMLMFITRDDTRVTIHAGEDVDEGGRFCYKVDTSRRGVEAYLSRFDIFFQ